MNLIDKEAWHRWLDKTGYTFEIPAFYYEDGDQLRLSAVNVAVWLAPWPKAMQSFLSQFKADSDDIELAKKECGNQHDQEAIQVLKDWLSHEQQD